MFLERFKEVENFTITKLIPLGGNNIIIKIVKKNSIYITHLRRKKLGQSTSRVNYHPSRRANGEGGKHEMWADQFYSRRACTIFPYTEAEDATFLFLSRTGMWYFCPYMRKNPFLLSSSKFYFRPTKFTSAPQMSIARNIGMQLLPRFSVEKGGNFDRAWNNKIVYATRE